MACSSPWDEEDNRSERISGDRREDRRYAIPLDLRWKLIRRRRVLDTGTGSTVDLSSGGIRFEAGRSLPEGFDVELTISWPALLLNSAAMSIVVRGRILRADGTRVAIRMTQYEFRTLGVAARQPAVPAPPAPPRVPFLRASGLPVRRPIATA
jgi:hypothetical protein